LFAVVGGGSLYKVEMFDFIEVQNEESKFPCGKFCVICSKLPDSSYSFIPDSWFLKKSKETPSVFIVYSKGISGVDWYICLFFFCEFKLVFGRKVVKDGLPRAYARVTV